MAEPATVALLITSSAKLLESGLKMAIWDGWSTPFPTHDRLAWVAKLLGLGVDLVGKAGELFKHVVPAAARPEHAVQLWAVHVACFGEALAVHWGGSAGMAGRTSRWGKWFAPAWVRERTREIDDAIRHALDLLAQGQPSPLPHGAWLAVPTSSPMYRALWAAFTGPGEENATPLIPLEQPGDVQAFERVYARNFREALARGGNAEMRALLTDGQPRGDALRRLLIDEMATWRYKHVFAGIDTSEGMPELPLEKAYVEPTATAVVDGGERLHEPVVALLERLLVRHRLIFVSADFGMGKSLTARTLAWRWAAAYLDPDGQLPGVDRIFPVHVRCSGNTSLRDGLDGILRRALKRNADAVGVSVRLDDAALAPPPAEQRAVILFDGLDELLMTSDQTRALIDDLLENATERLQFIVFSRPEALPRDDPDRRARVIPHVRIEPFGPQQIDEWLWAWPREAPTSRVLAARGLAELARVPILLFMLTLTWRHYAASEGAFPQARIYEAFFDTLAAGKYERGGEIHPQIRTAAQQARDVLAGLNEIPKWRSDEEGRSAAITAIRWLMERIAWEALRREFSGSVLTRRHVETLLVDELGLAESVVEQVRIGLLLGMQAQLTGGSQQFFFGHRSFLEFAAARYWERQLRRLREADPRRRLELEETLTGAPLVVGGSQVLKFLCEMLDAWTLVEQDRLLAWARATVADETITPGRGVREYTFRGDQRILVRQAALAIGCHLARARGEHFDVGDETVLLVIAVWWLTARSEKAVLAAPGIKIAHDASLVGLVVSLADLRSAEMVGANLRGVALDGANLVKADLGQAELDFASLRRADLTGAILEGAGLEHVNFEDALLKGANLDRTHMPDAKFFRADLERASLMEAHAPGASFVGANLRHANLFRADLKNADLRKADLREANLEETDLDGALLAGADLRGAWLRRAKLKRVELDGVYLDGADLDESVTGYAGVDEFGDVGDDEPDQLAEVDESEPDRAERAATEVDLDEEDQ